MREQRRPPQSRRKSRCNKVEESSFAFHPLTLDRWDDFEALVGPRGACSGCWCMWWRLAARDFREGAGATNRDRFRTHVGESIPPGVLAYADKVSVGWCAVASRESYPRLASSRILRPIDDVPVWSITCLFVARGYRRQGLTRLLIDAACRLASTFGASTVEAYPRVSPEEMTTPLALYTGTEGSFARAGFQVVARPTPVRRIMRKTL